MSLVPPSPVPVLELPAWPADAWTAWSQHTERAVALMRGPGTGRNFAVLVNEARVLLMSGDVAALTRRLEDRRFVRAVATVWAEDAVFARATVTGDLLALLGRRAFSRLTTLTLARFFLEHFDRFDDWQDGLFVGVRDLVRSAIASQGPRRDADPVEALRRHDEHLFERTGPRRLAAALVEAGVDLTGWFRRTLLSGYADSRFGRVARDEFYLAQITAADAEHGQHPFLAVITDEVLARHRTETTDRDGRYFGHQVLTALTDKTTRRPSDAWLQATLDIGGDPRMNQTPQWATWWSKVPQQNRTRAVRWMSGLNLTAFLEGVAAYAKATRNVSMQRMLERRKTLLSGLYEQDRIDDVRLVLGADIKRWITRSVDVSLADAAKLLDPGKDDTAVIYVNCRDFCLVEGSHNFKLHVYIGGPLSRLEDRSVKVIHGRYLRDSLPLQHVDDNGHGSYLDVTHHASGAWIRTSLDFLRRSDITVDERALMTSNDYADLARRRAQGWS